MEKHTKGPWKVNPYSGNSKMLIKEYFIDTFEEGGIKGQKYYHSIAEAYGEGNAHLISAAPDLLSCLQWAYDVASELLRDGDAREQAWLRRCEETLNKAEGEI